MSATRYRVTAPMVMAPSEEAARQIAALSPPQALAIGNHSQGAILPLSVPADVIDRMLAAGLIEAIEE